jgi:hypothetical protein
LQTGLVPGYNTNCEKEEQRDMPETGLSFLLPINKRDKVQ